MQNHRTSVGSLIVLGTLAVMGWSGFLILFLQRDQKSIQIPAPVVNVTSPTTPAPAAARQMEDYDVIYGTQALDPGNGGSGTQPEAVVAVGGRGHFVYGSSKGAIENALRDGIEASGEGYRSVRVISDTAPSPAQIVADLKSQKNSPNVIWIVAQIRSKGIEWRVKLPFTNVADTKARQLVDDERERRIKKIVAAAESGGNA